MDDHGEITMTAAQMLTSVGIGEHLGVRFRKVMLLWDEGEWTGEHGIAGCLRVRRGDKVDRIVITKLEIEQANFSVPHYLAERLKVSPENAAMAMSMPGKWILFAEPVEDGSDGGH